LNNLHQICSRLKDCKSCSWLKSSLTVTTMTRTAHLCHKWQRICAVFLYHNPLFSSFVA